MDQAAAARTFTPTPVVFRDGFGERRLIVDPMGTQKLEVLCLRADLTSTPSFEFALRERVSRLAGFRHTHVARIRVAERLADPGTTLALVSDATTGLRLSELMAALGAPHRLLDLGAALSVLQQLLPAVAALHASARDVAHGTIGPERIVVTPNARAVLVEHAMGAATEQLRFSHERYWRELRVPAPRSASLPKLDQRADVMQIGMVALALFLGRPITDEEYPNHLGDLVGSASAISPRGELEPLPTPLRQWLNRALQLAPRDAFTTAAEAHEELERVLAEAGHLVTPGALETFLARLNNPTAVGQESKPASPAAVPAKPVAPAASPAGRVPSVTSAPPAPAPAPASTVVPARQTAIPPAPIGVPTPPAAKTPGSAPNRLIAPPLETVVADRARTDDDELAVSEPGWSRTRLTAAAAVLVALLAGGALAAHRYLPSGAAASATGTLIVNTAPTGAQVIIDGQARGASPITLTVRPGAHTLELRGSTDSRTIPVTVNAGAQVSQYVELKAAATTGQIDVRTDPPGARVTIDGVAHGTSPVTVTDLLPGEHVVLLGSASGNTTQTVEVQAGATASVVATLTAPVGVPVSGWIAVTAPAVVQVFENGRLLGSSQSDRLMVAAGTHQLDIVNDALAFRATRTVQVSPGKVSAISIDFPKGTLALNAVPWADVWVDGEHIGQTPIGNYELPLGSHDVVFRHPDLGEQRQVVVVTAGTPARLSVDMRKQP